MKKRTKILATVGPASDSVETLSALIRAGVNVFRMNFSHGTHEHHSRVIANIRQAMKETGLVVGILQDICGPKIRVGQLAEEFHLTAGDTIEFVKETVLGKMTGPGRYRACINHPEILGMLKQGDYIYLYDGNIRARVCKCGETVVTEVENNGILSSNKGVNFPNTSLGIEVLTEKDRDDMLWGIRHGVDFMAISFVQCAEDMKKARQIVSDHGGRQHLIAKIEKFDAVENIDAILDASDGLMVARGDLGIEVPYFEVPSIQKMLIRKANVQGKPVITATQMLLSMTEKETATRAEISDVANAVFDGTDAVMLSEETAVGQNSVLAVETMFNTIVGAEKAYPFYSFGKFEHIDKTDVIEESMVLLAKHLGARGIFALTSSGGSVRKLARYRPDEPIYAVTHNDKTARTLTLVWGVVPAFSIKKDKVSPGMVLSEVISSGLERNVIDLDATYILTAGDPVGEPGTTNTIRILRRNEMEFFLNLPQTLKKKKPEKKEEKPTLF
jgi:pyruvate kinase